MKVLFVTTEMDDFVRVGGLAAVSAALPRALRPWSDVRIMLPGYRDVVEQFTHIEIVGQCAALAEMPACSLGRASTRDGLPVYVLLCPQLYDRPGNPYGDESGRDWPDNDVRFGRFASAAAELAMGTLDKNWAADLVHANDWQAALAPAYLAWKGARIPSILTIHNLAYQGLFPRESLRRIGAPEEFLPYRWARILRQAILPQGRHRLRLASDDRQRDLCEGDHDARTRLRARRPAAAPLGRPATDRHTERHRRKLGSRAPARNWRRRLAPAIGRASRPTPITSASSLAWRCRAARFSVLSPVWCIRRASISYCPPPTKSSRPAGRSWLPAAASRYRAGAGRCASPPARRDRRRDRLQRRPGAANFRRQRFYADAVAVRTVRAEPDVCAAIRIAADRSPDRRTGRDHQGRRNRIPVRAAVGGIFPRRRAARVRSLQGQRPPRHDAAQRDGAIL